MSKETPSAETNHVPSGALADMAMRLAEVRGGVTGFWTVHRIPPCDRSVLNPAIHPVSDAYYRIIDCIAYGHEWRAEKEFNSCGRCHKVKTNRDFKPGEFHRGY